MTDPLATLASDLRHAVQYALRHKLVSIAVVITVALSVGVLTTAYALVTQVLLRPLPYDDSGRIAVLSTTEGRSPVPEPGLSAPDFLEVQREIEQFESVAGAVGFTVPLTGDGDAVEIRSAMVTWNFFPLLGVDPALGRHFRPEEQGGPSRVALIAHDLWLARYGGDPAAIGRRVLMNGSPVEIIGVLPEDFVFYAPEGSPSSIASTDALKVWEVFRFDLSDFARRERFLTTVARLDDGASWQEVDAAMTGLSRDLRRRVAAYEGRRVALRAAPFKAAVLASTAAPLWAVFGAAALVLALAGSNLLALAYARAVARGRELSVRIALGASRGRLTRMILSESTVVAAVGGLLGAGVGRALLTAVQTVAVGSVPRLAGASIDVDELLFSLACGFVVMLSLPVASTRLLDEGVAVGGGLRTRSGATRRTRIFREGLIAAQVATSVALLIASGLVVRTLHGLVTADRGFDPSGHTVTFFPSMGYFRYGGDESVGLVLSFHDELLRRLREHPLVTAVGTTRQPPLAGPGLERTVGFDAASERDWGSVRVESRTVSDGYFEAIGTPIRSGRGFRRSDQQGQPRVAVVDEVLAHRAWPDEDPLGRTLLVHIGTNGVAGERTERVRVVGVAAAAREDVRLDQGKGRIYLPFAQNPSTTAFYVIRAAGPTESVVALARDVVREFDPDIAVTRIQSLEQSIVEATGRERLVLLLMLTFATAAFALALIGVYGVVSFVVARRSSEYGVRLALGARPYAVFIRVLVEALRPALWGLAIGVGGIWLAGRVLESTLYGVSAHDPVTYALACAAIGAAVSTASAVPATRALRVDPAEVLAAE